MTGILSRLRFRYLKFPLGAAKWRKRQKRLRILELDSGTFQKGWDMNGDMNR